jgi:hypothetical protein
MFGKEFFTYKKFVEVSLPSATLGKSFAECNSTFPKCLRTYVSCSEYYGLVYYINKIHAFENTLQLMAFTTNMIDFESAL